jgi:membrane-bound lytic murein transglycosylase B
VLPLAALALALLTVAPVSARPLSPARPSASAQPPAPTPTGPPAQPADPAAPEPPPLDTAAFAVWLETLRRDALASGISAATVSLALTSVELQPVVLERDRSQAEFSLTLREYLERRVSRSTVTQARRKSAEHRRLLAKVQAAHQVPPAILTAVWGLESNFGRFSGVRPTVPVLATLAFEGRRGDLFRAELLDALRILDRGDIDLADMRGSWAGAMGQPQFLPSSYLKYAQDFDGNGRRDIWTSMPDVFASIAFYLKSKGWIAGQTWGRRVRVPETLAARLPDVAPLREEGCRALRGLTHPLPLSRWRALGIRTASGGALPRAAVEASLLRADGDAFLVYPNYETLLSYNCAHTYALSVALLADRLQATTGSRK